jgi:hypothetical protein
LADLTNGGSLPEQRLPEQRLPEQRLPEQWPLRHLDSAYLNSGLYDT